jgi:hypothetical protein
MSTLLNKALIEVTKPALVWRVRVRETGEMGTVIDVDPTDGWIYWFGEDRSCHVSKPDFLETVS